MKNKIILILFTFFIVVLGVLFWKQILGGKKQSEIPAEILEAAKDFKNIPDIRWETFYKFDYETGKGPKELMDLDGKLVKVPGYIVPLTDNAAIIKEFILVPDSQSCVHVPPPPPNLIVNVVLRNALPADEVSNPSWVIGIFKIEKTEHQYGGSSYSIDAIDLEDFDFEDYDDNY